MAPVCGRCVVVSTEVPDRAPCDGSATEKAKDKVGEDSACRSEACVVVLRSPLASTTENAVSVLVECGKKHNLFGNRPASRKDTRVYNLQGWNIENPAVCIDFESPATVSIGIRYLILESMSTLQRGKTLTCLVPEEQGIILQLDNVVCKVMQRCATFPEVKNFTSDYELGYVGLMRMPIGSTVRGHKDPPKECDLAAVFVFQGAADITVGSHHHTHLVSCGDMYIFQPTLQQHSVGSPLGNEERCAVALRYYRRDREDARPELQWSPKALGAVELERRQLKRQQEVLPFHQFAGVELNQLTPCRKCSTPNLALATHCVFEDCRAELSLQKEPCMSDPASMVKEGVYIEKESPSDTAPCEGTGTVSGGPADGVAVVSNSMDAAAESHETQQVPDNSVPAHTGDNAEVVFEVTEAQVETSARGNDEVVLEVTEPEVQATATGTHENINGTNTSTAQVCSGAVLEDSSCPIEQSTEREVAAQPVAPASNVPEGDGESTTVRQPNSDRQSLTVPQDPPAKKKVVVKRVH